MKTIKKTLALLCILTFLLSCEKKEDPVVVNETSTIPTTNLGRENTYLGCMEISTRETTIEVWDHGQIDNDIVSIIANGEVIVDQQVLDGPFNGSISLSV
ncbi:hypothetical protein [Tamlana crocina]|uniref:Auto-transporter adhesin head GIN domain-containing protein n=1 Tax=Tamlana crocina TaxID=393006 RepID=A0ABX1DE58_9FLAO|nr:hypothetical protein [Tamlana crocina]NJX16347.1 hypothetical protein [Tamlana crocina]